MSRILLALLCCIGFNVEAMVLAPDQTAASKQAAHINPAKTSNSPVKPAPLPPPSKITLGFFSAFSNMNWDMMELYAKQGADISCRNCNSEQISPLHVAAKLAPFGGWGQSMQLTKWLIERGANVNQANSHGITPVMLAVGSTQMAVQMGPQIAQGDDNLLSYLIEHGANVLAVDADGNTAFQYLSPVVDQAQGYSVGLPVAYQKIANILIDKGSNINHQNKLGETALIIAANNCADASVKFLLASGADTSKTNKLNQTAMDIAMDKATKSGQNSFCNNTVKILSKTPQASRATSNPSYANSNQQSVSVYADSYAGTFSGADYGIFQATISQDGTAYLSGRSEKNGISFTGEGKISSDGTITMGSVSTGTEFTGTVNTSGVLSGSWKNKAYNLSGSFEGQKGTTNAAATPKPLDAIGNIFGILGTILKPQ